MSDTRDHKDSEISHIYKEGGWPEPSRQIDAAILAAARAQHSFLRRWTPPLALAATVVLSFTLLLRMSEEKSNDALYSLPIPARQPATEEPKPATAPEPTPAPKPASVPKSAPAVKPAAPPRLAPAPRPAAAPPAAAASAFALKKEAPGAARADRLERTPEARVESRRAPESTAPIERQTGTPAEPTSAPERTGEMSMPRPAPAPAASGAAASPDAAAGIVVRRSAPERTPQAWIENIRKLRAEGRTEEAGRELAEFRKRYPDYALPEDLR